MSNNETIDKLNQTFNSSPPSFTNGGSTTANRVLDSHNILGECILYDDIRDEIVWTDIDGREFHRLNLGSGKHTVFSLPKILCAFALRPKGEKGYLFA